MKKILHRLQRKPLSNNEPLGLRRNFSWTFMGNVVYGACQWGILVILAKIGTPEMLGQFSLGLAIVTPVILFSNLHLRAVQVTDVKQDYSFNYYLVLRIITTIFAFFVIVGLIFLGDYQGTTSLVILFVGLAKAIESISDILYGLLQQKERMDNVSRSIIIRSLLSITTVFIGLYVTKSLTWATLGLTVAAAFTLLVIDIPISPAFTKVFSRQQQAGGCYLYLRTNLRKIYQFSSEWQKLANLAWFSLPVGGIMMLLALSTNFPRYIIERYLGQSELGIFAALAYIPTAGVIVVSALGQSALPRLTKYYAQQSKSAYIKLIIKIICIAIVLGLTGLLVSILFGNIILNVLYRSEYAERGNVFILLMVWGCFSYVSAMLGYVTASARYFKSSFLVALIKCLIIILVSFFLIPVYKLQGSAIVLIIDEILQIIGFGMIINHIFSKMKNLENNIASIDY